jgi:hypothetical protein
MAYTSTHQLYAAATSVGGDAVCQIIIPVSGRIVAVQMNHTTTSSGGITRVETSLQSTNQFTTNDSRNVLSSLVYDSSGNSGGPNPACLPQMLCDVPVTEMDRVYVHVLQTSAAWRIVGMIWLRH